MYMAFLPYESSHVSVESQDDRKTWSISYKYVVVLPCESLHVSVESSDDSKSVSKFYRSMA